MTRHELSIRAQALTLMAFMNMTNAISKLTGIPERQLKRLKENSFQREFNQVGPRIRAECIDDAPKPGRPKIMTGNQDGFIAHKTSISMSSCKLSRNAPIPRHAIVVKSRPHPVLFHRL